MTRHIIYGPRYTQRYTLGDSLDDLLSSFNLTSDPSLQVPDISDGDILPIMTPLNIDTSNLPTFQSALPSDTAPTSLVPSSSASLVQFNPATSDSSWAGILSNIAKALPGIATAAGTVATTNAAVQAQQAQLNAQQAAALQPFGTSFSNLINGPYGIYLIGGGFILLALAVSGGSGGGGRRR